MRSFSRSLGARGITYVFIFFLYSVSLFTDNLGLVLELAGGFSATALAYIFRTSRLLRLAGTQFVTNSSLRVISSGSMLPEVINSRKEHDNDAICSVGVSSIRRERDGFKYEFELDKSFRKAREWS